MPPSLLAVLEPAALAGVATVVSAGERLDPVVAAAWGPGRRLLNAYGPTEATVCAALAVTSPADAGAPPVGSPSANARVHVLDRYLGLVPAGVPG